MTGKEFIQVIIKGAFGDKYVATPPSASLLMLNKVLKDLEVLEILKKIVKISDFSKYPIASPDDQLFILSGGEIKDVKEFDKIKDWLKGE